MKEIKLTKGYFAIVDDDDYEYLNQWKWYAQPSHGKIIYAYRMGKMVKGSKRPLIAMHRLLLNPSEGFEVDHINRNGIDNRRDNIRIVSRNENHINKSNTKKYPGVRRQGNRYEASIVIKGERHYLGSFDTPELACKSYLDRIMSLRNTTPTVSHLKHDLAK